MQKLCKKKAINLYIGSIPSEKKLNMKRKKSIRFFLLLPVIEQLINEGYTQQSIVEKLQMDHELNLNLNTFKSYLYRYRSQDKDIQEKPSSYRQKEKPTSSFLSSFQDAEIKDNDSNQVMNLSVSRSRDKAKALLESMSLSEMK